MNWTEEQALAINQEGSNIIVSAGAGSGKTAVLSERVLRKLKEGVDIRKILMLTFTNEAAGEMAMRIRKKIKKAGLKDQLEYINSAYITTFDAYALSIVKKYHYLLGLPKQIKIIDSSIILLEKKKILEDIFKTYYENKDKRFLKLIGDFTNRDDSSIMASILSINDSLNLKYDKEEYLEKYIPNFYNSENINKLFIEYFNYLKNLAEILEEDIYAIESFMEEKDYLKLYEAVNKLFKPNEYNDLHSNNNLKLPAFRNLDEEGVSLKENIKNTFTEIIELTYYSEEELKKQLESTKDYVSIIIDIIKELEEKLDLYKYKNGAFEFVDIAKMAIKIVYTFDSVRDELKYYFNEIMIDEYQDTSDLQEIFIKAIANNNVYMVGDIKQSIYRFRNANPNIFKDKYDNYSNHLDGEKIDLLKNFRSREEVLFNINEIFNYIMTESIGSVNYQNNHAMVYGNHTYEKEGANKENHDLEILKYDDTDKEYSCDEYEAFIIAKDILNKINNHYEVFDFDLNSNREAKFNDFCIILDRGSAMNLYKKIFEYFHIPLELYKDSNLINENDIYIIKNIISLILAIYDKNYGKETNYYFTSIARSYVGSMQDSEIYDVLKEHNLFSTTIYKKCEKLAKSLELKTPNSLLQEIINEFAFYENLILVGNIEAAKVRISHLLDLSLNMESLGFTIRDLKTYLEEMTENESEIRYKEAKSEGNCVKIMNIHKSKGLEFPVCYFAGFKKKFNLRDLQNRFLFDNHYGIMTPFYQDGVASTFIKTLIKKNYYEEEISEKVRLFYVALTRAKEKMIMVIPNFKSEHQIKKSITYLEGIKFRSFYDFINTISLNLKNYMQYISSAEIDITKDYELTKKVEKSFATTDEKIILRENKHDFKIIENKHASKTIENILSYEEEKTLEFGTNLHEKLELTDFKKPDASNIYINNLIKQFNFQEAKIYQELEFIFREEETEYHGIIDLMLEYPDEIKIIDYKLKNIKDKAYQKQLDVYRRYIKKVSNKSVRLYLYSILDNEVLELTPKEVVN
mgnify:CR=1 FL=1